MSSSIELDCAPMTPRPDTYLPGVLKGTGLKLGKTASRFFGNWEWIIPDDQEELYQKNVEVIAERITKLYNDGAIRYGSW